MDAPSSTWGQPCTHVPGLLPLTVLLYCPTPHQVIKCSLSARAFPPASLMPWHLPWPQSIQSSGRSHTSTVREGTEKLREGQQRMRWAHRRLDQHVQRPHGRSERGGKDSWDCTCAEMEVRPDRGPALLKMLRFSLRTSRSCWALQTEGGLNRFAFSKPHYDYSAKMDKSEYKMDSGEATTVNLGKQEGWPGSGYCSCWEKKNRWVWKILRANTDGMLWWMEPAGKRRRCWRWWLGSGLHEAATERPWLT